MLRSRLTALGRPGFVRVVEPRILVESTLTLRLEDIFAYEEAQTGDCIVQVPEVRREYVTCFCVSIRRSTYPQTKIAFRDIAVARLVENVVAVMTKECLTRGLPTRPTIIKVWHVLAIKAFS